MRALDHIVSDCLSGKPSAQRELYDRYASRLLGICFRYSNGRDDAEEILQQSFIKIFTRMESFSNQGSFEGWMKRITINTALNFLSSQKRLGFTDSKPPTSKARSTLKSTNACSTFATNKPTLAGRWNPNSSTCNPTAAAFVQSSGTTKAASVQRATLPRTALPV